MSCKHNNIINAKCQVCKQRFLYDNGLPFSDGLDKNILQMRKRIEGNKASLMIVSGPVGEGKTTLMVHIAEYYQGAPIDFSKQIAYGGEEFQEKLQICIDDKLPVLIYDEAGDFNSRGSLTQFNQKLNRVFETYRTFRIFIILGMPNFAVLDSSIFDKGIPRVLLYCYNRNNKWGNYKGYSLNRMYYVKEKMKKITVPPMAFGLVTANFHGRFLDLFPDRSDDLNRFSSDAKKEILNENVLQNRGLLTAKKMCSILNMSLAWLRVKFRELNVQPAYVYKKVNYYEPDIINKLKRLIP